MAHSVEYLIPERNCQNLEVGETYLEMIDDGVALLADNGRHSLVCYDQLIPETEAVENHC